MKNLILFDTFLINLNDFFQAKKAKTPEKIQLSAEQQAVLDSYPDADHNKFFQTPKKKEIKPMPLIYRKAGFTQELTEHGTRVYIAPCGTRVNPSGKKCRQKLSKILKARPELSYLSDTVKLGSPEKKSDVCQGPRRSTAIPQTTASEQSSPTTDTSTTTSQGSKHAYGYFKTLSPEEQFLGICGSEQMTQFFEKFGDVAKCGREVDGANCGGKYGVTGFVTTGTGNEMTCKLACDRCGHERYFGDGSRTKNTKQRSQCGPLNTPQTPKKAAGTPQTPKKAAGTPQTPNISGTAQVPNNAGTPQTPTAAATPQATDDERIKASIGQTVLYNFLLSGRGMFDQYDSLHGRTGDAYSRPTFDKAVKTCMKVVMEVLDEEVAAVEKYLRQHGLWKTCYIGVDGSWCTPGASAPHGMFCARALQAWGGLLGYHFMSRNDPDHPYLFTSASMEVIGCIKVWFD